MKTVKYIYRLLAVGGLLLGASCNDYLDTVPDNRTEIDTPEKVGKLVASAYPKACYAINFNARVDYVTDSELSNKEKLSNTDPFFWREPNSTAQDSPNYLWSQCYRAISHANAAIEASARFDDELTAAYIAEARLARAYSHFLLVTTFAQMYDPTAPEANDEHPGVPYVDESEDVSIKQYDRETVARTYERIGTDLTYGLEHLGSDAVHRVPRYHFNYAAAHTFASRYYAFRGEWEKVVEEASKVIPKPTDIKEVAPGIRNVSATDPAAIFALDNFQPWTTDYAKNGVKDVRPWYWRMTTKSNLLLCEMISSVASCGTMRYACSLADTNNTVNSANPTGGKWAYMCSGDNKPFSWVGKYENQFTKNNIYSTTGNNYSIYMLLHAEEALFNRIEAYIHLGQLDEAVADLNIFCRTRIFDHVTKDAYDEEEHCLTLDRIYDFYAKYKPANGTPYEVLLADGGSKNPDYFMNKYNAYDTSSWDVKRQALLHFLLDCRRNEFLFEGIRYWDMWRYRIPIYHVTQLDQQGPSNWLMPGDDRWVLQIPEESVLSGVELNPRERLLTPEW